MKPVPKVLREGFHEFSDGGEPVGDSAPWPGQLEFLQALTALESTPSEKLHNRRVRGFGVCPKCGKTVRSLDTYTYEVSKVPEVSWVWPGSYRHHVEVHNKQPSPAFHGFVRAVTTQQNERLIGTKIDGLHGPT